MKLIRELVEDTEVIVEEASDGSKEFYITGPFLVAETKNRNGRLYPKHIMQNEVNRYTREMIESKRAVGQLNHPESPALDLERASHLITSLKEDGNQWIGKAKILDTPMGTIARNLIEGGVCVGVSSRGIGSLKNINGINVVQDDFRLSTAADIVADPSAPGAFVQGIMENAEWVLVDGIWTQQNIEESQKLIRQVSQKEIEQVSLKIFEKFLAKL